MVNSTTINARIKDLGVKVSYTRGDGYFYFTRLDDGSCLDSDSVMVCYLNQLTLEQWRNEAKSAIEQDTNRKVRFSN